MNKVELEIVGDMVVDLLERIMDGPWIDRACWALMGAAAVYFVPRMVAVLIR
ncbi:MAG TPA: hypothetical protein VLH09_02550 [Bryobacteraceae bacterium]|nr:hypothetical protein [Bryobacteraceae bacterium]